MRVEDAIKFEEELAEMIVAVEVNSDNISDYINDPVYFEDDPSDGLVFLGAGEDFTMTATVNYFDYESTWDMSGPSLIYLPDLAPEYEAVNYIEFKAAKGTLYFIKSEHVDDYCIDENGIRNFSFLDFKCYSNTLNQTIESDVEGHSFCSYSFGAPRPAAAP